MTTATPDCGKIGWRIWLNRRRAGTGAAPGKVTVSTLDAVRQLSGRATALAPKTLADMAMRAAPLLDVAALVVYVVDHQQRELRPLLGGHTPNSYTAPIDGTLAGRASALSHRYATDKPPLRRSGFPCSTAVNASVCCRSSPTSHSATRMSLTAP